MNVAGLLFKKNLINALQTKKYSLKAIEASFKKQYEPRLSTRTSSIQVVNQNTK